MKNVFCIFWGVWEGSEQLDMVIASSFGLGVHQNGRTQVPIKMKIFCEMSYVRNAAPLSMPKFTHSQVDQVELPEYASNFKNINLVQKATGI